VTSEAEFGVGTRLADSPEKDRPHPEEVAPVDHPYFDLNYPKDVRELTSYFVLDSLLRSRIECGFESDTTRWEETVNVYLVHLLSTIVHAPTLGAYAAERDIDVFEQVRHSTDSRFKCEVYRVNADHLLLSTGIFTDSPFVEREGVRVFEGDARDRIGRGKAYYHYASHFSDRVRAAPPAVSHVLAQLSAEFEKYVTVLFHMRGEYFNLYERMNDTQFASLAEKFFGGLPPLADADVPKLRDGFLDAYWVWHQTPTPETRAALDDAIKRLRDADPDFEFPLPEA
jgi:hypothetical protein